MKTLYKLTPRTRQKIRNVYEEPDLTPKTKTELQTICDELGVSKTGTKAEIIERILLKG